ncbi:MAG TPA: luciferase family protein [Gaiellaceae bacterium]|nr:luciferase family protein [Gaiellaceae bacterium]
MDNIGAQIEQEITRWDGVSVHDHRFGGREFRLDRRMLGHLHGERWADLLFHRGVRDMLVETGRAQPHHVHPDSGWVSRQIRTETDVQEVVELFRLAYERARVAEKVASER